MYSASYIRQRVNQDKAKLNAKIIGQLIQLLDTLFRLASEDGNYGIYLMPLPDDEEARKICIADIEKAYPALKDVNFVNVEKTIYWHEIYNYLFTVAYWRVLQNKLRHHGYKANRIDNIGFDATYSAAISISWEED